MNLDEPADPRTSLTRLVNYFGLTAHIGLLFFVAIFMNRDHLGEPKADRVLLLITLVFVVSPLISLGLRRLIGGKWYRILMALMVGLWLLAGANGLHTLLFKEPFFQQVELMQGWFH